MSSVVQLQIWQFSLIYVLLVVVGLIMKKCGVNQIKQLTVSSVRMTLQLVLAGLILTYIFKNPHPAFTISYVVIMISFAIYRVLSKNKELNKNFKIIIGISMALSGLTVLLFFILAVIHESIFNPQYVIPISGMIMGNMMTGVSLGVKTFRESLEGQSAKINALTYIGAKPRMILLPFFRQAMETAMVPTLNSMVGMGIVALPGMMTGQILSGTLPMTAILYQIAIMICICAVVAFACFSSLYFGHKTLYNNKEHVIVA